MESVIAGATALFVLVSLAYLVGRATTRSSERMRGGSDDLRRADDGGPGHYSDYGSPMG